METAESLAMLRLLSGYWFSQALYVVAVLGVADHLKDGPRTADQLASEVGADAEALHRLLRGLSSAGIFSSSRSGFELNALARTLCTDREGSLHAMAVLGGHPMHWNAWGKLLDSVRTGKSAFELAHGQKLFEALAKDHELSAHFQAVMDRSNHADGDLIETMKLARFRRIVDVGGGAGGFARAIATALPEARVISFDRPEVIAGARQDMSIDVLAGDFWKHVPPGADAYILKFVLHDWPDAEAVEILSRCREAMSPHARLFIVEVLLPEDATPSIAKTHDINMMVLTGGRERTLDQYGSLAASAGLAIASSRTTEQGLGIIELSIEA
jgi:hypothetical protein